MASVHRKTNPSRIQFYFSTAALCLICLASGCAGGMFPSSFSEMLPGNQISGQFEPEIDYEAEARAREQQSKTDQ